MYSKAPLSIPFVCRKSVSFIPDTTPFINRLSNNSSVKAIYTVVTIYGNNFNLHGIRGYSSVNFTSDPKNSYYNLPVTFYNSKEISFLIPIHVKTGNYLVSVINKQHPISLVSNSINYTIISSS